MKVTRKYVISCHKTTRLAYRASALKFCFVKFAKIIKNPNSWHVYFEKSKEITFNGVYAYEKSILNLT